jgi:hypothetical protein
MEHIESGAEVAFIPPVIILVIGAALAWALRPSRQRRRRLMPRLYAQAQAECGDHSINRREVRVAALVQRPVEALKAAPDKGQV